MSFVLQSTSAYKEFVLKQWSFLQRRDSVDWLYQFLA